MYIAIVVMKGANVLLQESGDGSCFLPGGYIDTPTEKDSLAWGARFVKEQSGVACTGFAVLLSGTCYREDLGSGCPVLGLRCDYAPQAAARGLTAPKLAAWYQAGKLHGDWQEPSRALSLVTSETDRAVLRALLSNSPSGSP